MFSEAELERLRRFPREVSQEELVRFFTLTRADLGFIQAHRGTGNWLGLAVQLCTLPWLGYVPDDVFAAPAPAVARLVAELRRYLKATGYTHGPIFRAEKNGVGGPLRYSTVQEHWARYTAAAGVSATCISSDTPTPPNSSTAASACPPFANASDTRTSRPPFATPNNPTATADAELRAWRRARA
jgi:hypothetical protein